MSKNSISCAISEEDLKNQPDSTFTITTSTINISEPAENKLSEKEELVERLIKEGKIDIKEAMVLLRDGEVVVKEITPYWSQPIQSPNPYIGHPTKPWGTDIYYEFTTTSNS